MRALRLCLACCALAYPCWWTAQFINGALPAFFRVAVLGHELDWVRANRYGISAGSFPSNFNPETKQARRQGPGMGSLVAAVVVSAVVLLVVRRPIAGFFVATLGLAGLMPLLMAMMFRRRFIEFVLMPSICFLPLLCAGLWRLFHRWSLSAPVSWRSSIAGAVLSALFAIGTGVANRTVTAAPSVPSHPVDERFHKGVNFTAEGPVGYAGARAVRMLEALPAYGVNSIALVPYGFLTRDSQLVRLNNAGGWESDAGITRLSVAAHKLGQRVLLKPHVWRQTNLDLADPERRRQWFASYVPFIEHYARLAGQIHADMFSVGVEFVTISRYEAEWRDIIARVRRIYSGPLVYGANFGPDFENLPFWDALDYIGLDNYYPLPDNLDASEVIRKIEAVQRRFGKPVIFTEAGFSSFASPHREPWADSPRRRLAPDEQARCYEALFRAFHDKPWFRGVYWWKVGSNAYGGPEDGSHTPWRKPAMQVIKRWYTESIK